MAFSRIAEQRIREAMAQGHFDNLPRAGQPLNLEGYFSTPEDLRMAYSERKQRVVSTGVYAFVRHPMYLGMILMFAGAPLLLGSRFGLLVAAAITLLLAVRITREERLLADELDGYQEYRRTVRYGLLPFVW